MSDNEREMEPDDLDEPMNDDGDQVENNDTYVPIGEPDENGVPVPKNERITVSIIFFVETDFWPLFFFLV